MKRTILLVLFFALALAGLNAQTQDTANGWSIYRISGDSTVTGTTHIVTGIATEGIHSQSFAVNLRADNYVQWKKNYGKSIPTPKYFEVSVRLDSLNPNIFANGVWYQFFLVNGDSLFPIRAGGLANPAMNKWFIQNLGTTPYGTPPPTFNGLILLLRFVGPSANGYEEIKLDDLKMLYMTGFNIDSAVTIDRFGDSTLDGVTENENGPPKEFRLSQNYPNPWNPSTTISFELGRTAFTTLKVYNALGQEVATLVSEIMAPGGHEIRFSGNNLPSGTYFYRLQTGTFAETKKLVLLK